MIDPMSRRSQRRSGSPFALLEKDARELQISLVNCAKEVLIHNRLKAGEILERPYPRRVTPHGGLAQQPRVHLIRQ